MVAVDARSRSASVSLSHSNLSNDIDLKSDAGSISEGKKADVDDDDDENEESSSSESDNDTAPNIRQAAGALRDFQTSSIELPHEPKYVVGTTAAAALKADLVCLYACQELV